MNKKWDERYISGDLPWDTGAVDERLKKIIEEYSIAPCKSVDIGCGTGTNALWLASQGFDILGIDISKEAVKTAKNKARNAGVNIRFEVRDIVHDGLPKDSFSFAFDRGCLHSIEDTNHKKIFAQFVYDSLSENGLWFSLIGNSDDAPRNVGPPRLSAHDITGLVEGGFKILMLRASRSGTHPTLSIPPLFWECLMQKR